jgi:3,5-dihydroxyphenylacetyl-CoA synthase
MQDFKSPYTPDVTAGDEGWSSSAPPAKTLSKDASESVRVKQDSPAASATLRSVGTANPPRRYGQEELLSLYGVSDPKLTGLFRNAHIRSRHLCLPTPTGPGQMPDESPAELRAKHLSQSMVVGGEAVLKALGPLGLTPRDVDYLLCVTSTGFLCPGLSAHFIRRMGFRPDVQRVDIVGMGCNAGLNGMQPVANFCERNPGKIGLLLCVEICSAIYVFDLTVRTAVSNSLFGDGAAAAVVTTRPMHGTSPGFTIMGFESHIISAQIDAMRFDLDGVKNSFVLDPEVPYVVGANVEKPVDRLLTKFNVKRRDISHWVIHSGGRKVIDAIRCALNLSHDDVRNTESILREYGNLSSGSFLFSHQRLLGEDRVRPGEFGVMITMGPGSTIETCLGRFS